MSSLLFCHVDLLWELVADLAAKQVLVGPAWSSCTGYGRRWRQVILQHKEAKYVGLLQCYSVSLSRP